MRRLPLFAMIFGTGAVLLAAILVFRGYFSAGKPPPAKPHTAIAAPPPVAKIGVVELQHDLAAGTLLQPGMLVQAMVPANSIHPGDEIWTTARLNQLSGAMLKQSAVARTRLTSAMVIVPGSHGFLAATLKPGYAAMTIAVDPVADASGLIWPGDNVAVLLVRSATGQPPAGKQVAGDMAISASTVVGNTRVVATGSEIIHSADPKKQDVKVGTVTLEVTPRQAEKIVVAQKLGSLAVSLLSATKPPSAAQPVWGYEVAAKLPDHLPSGQATITVLSPTQSQGFSVP